MKILFLTNVPSPYRVNFFNELGKKCELTVLFEKKTSDERHESWKEYEFNTFNGVFLKGKSVSTDKAICLDVFHYLKDPSYDYIICANMATPTGIMSILYMKLHKIKYYIEADGGYPNAKKGFKVALKKYLMSGAKGYFSTSGKCDEYFMLYGDKNTQIIRYPFTSLYHRDIYKEIANAEEKKKLREKLGIKEENIIISVGRFSYLNGYGKGYDVILRSAAQLSDQNIGWYIIGGEPTEEFIQFTEKLQLSNVHYIEFKKKKELKEYYRAADVFVLMTIGDVWGLVINEAMACGLPVITTNKCVAGIELVEDGVNGYIVDVGDDRNLTRCAAQILNTDGAVQKMGEMSLKRIASYTYENMVKAHIDVLMKYR